MSHTVRSVRYIRYGDDMLLFANTRKDAEEYRTVCIYFLKETFCLETNHKTDMLVPVYSGIRYLGVELFPSGRRLLQRGWRRAHTMLSGANIGSYYGLVQAHMNKKHRHKFDWHILLQNNI